MSWEATAPHLWGALPLDRRELHAVLLAMCARLETEIRPPASVPELVITDDAGIEACNRDHLNCTGPTNILSFPLPRQGGQGGPLGSLVLSAPTLRRESLLYGQTGVNHAVRLLAHGLAHLTGLEHGREMWDLCARLEEAGLDSLSRLRGAPLS